ncbi:hypothetical protein HNY73_006998 [Argiope bruennichi]|uniref:Uncharacterized protein n=1 Tax=Argiope bruennichi TaxID=94029 RepID=A0A8T0FD14_ARGBR|nr:hypothetical protein HNY73_006998 [Argiope bruennichi]
MTATLTFWDPSPSASFARSYHVREKALDQCRHQHVENDIVPPSLLSSSSSSQQFYAQRAASTTSGAETSYTGAIRNQFQGNPLFDQTDLQARSGSNRLHRAPVRSVSRQSSFLKRQALERISWGTRRFHSNSGSVLPALSRVAKRTCQFFNNDSCFSQKGVYVSQQIGLQRGSREPLNSLARTIGVRRK